MAGIWGTLVGSSTGHVFGPWAWVRWSEGQEILAGRCAWTCCCWQCAGRASVRPHTAAVGSTHAPEVNHTENWWARNRRTAGHIEHADLWPIFVVINVILESPYDRLRAIEATTSPYSQTAWRSTLLTTPLTELVLSSTTLYISHTKTARQGGSFKLELRTHSPFQPKVRRSDFQKSDSDSRADLP